MKKIQGLIHGREEISKHIEKLTVRKEGRIPGDLRGRKTRVMNGMCLLVSEEGSVAANELVHVMMR